MTTPLLVLQVGDFPVALHPTESVLVVPDGSKAVITLTPQQPVTASSALGCGAAGPRSLSGGVVADAINGERSMKLLPGRWRNRRKCCPALKMSMTASLSVKTNSVSWCAC
ncbi:hypothetical protein [Mycobacterium intracellulare]|uniref:hypothetical protein n=1 Tax=Mycobacterium intracellulare TaxID=1767 RepID=UPI0011AB46FB|nr:hypothetical protein [Mycobacterium intracellulare]